MEGETDDPAVLALRKQLMKNYACYLLFSSGTPMILGGDEFARSQRGNNNAYCQDNEISWFDWTALSQQRGDLRVLSKGDRVHAALPGAAAPEVLSRQGPGRRRRAGPHLVCAGPGATRAGTMPNVRTLCYQLDASEDGSNLGVDRLFFILNAHYESQWVKLPPLESGHALAPRDRHEPAERRGFRRAGQEIRIDPPDHYIANPRSTVVLLAQRLGSAKRSETVQTKAESATAA